MRKDCLTEIILRAANSIYSPHFAIWPAKKERFRDDQFIIWPRVCSDNNCNSLHLHSREKRVVKDLVVLLK